MFSGLFGTCDIQLFGAAIPITAVVSFAFFMAALFNRAGHYIFALWFLSSSFFFCLFFPYLISVAADWMSTILPDMVWP